MLYNPVMKGTNRIAIKSKKGKFLIVKNYVDDVSCLFFIFPKDSHIALSLNGDVVDITSENVALFVSKMEIREKEISLQINGYTNVFMDIDYDAFDDIDYDDIVEYYNMTTDEPEEETHSFECRCDIEEIDEVIADPNLFIELLNDETIVADEETLEKHQLLPNIRMYTNTNKKGKSKIKYIR